MNFSWRHRRSLFKPNWRLLPALSLPLSEGSYTSDHLLSPMASPAAACLVSPSSLCPSFPGFSSCICPLITDTAGVQAPELPLSLSQRSHDSHSLLLSCQFSLRPLSQASSCLLDISFGCPTPPEIQCLKCMFPSSFPDFPNFLSDSKHRPKPANSPSSPLSHGFFVQICVTSITFHSTQAITASHLFSYTSLLVRLPVTGLHTQPTVLMCHSNPSEILFLTLQSPAPKIFLASIQRPCTSRPQAPK